MKFELHPTSEITSRARRGTVTTARGIAIETPVFMPVGTRGTVRTQTLAQLDELGPAIILANTYHLLVRPGAQLMTELGGLHAWMKWPRAILTDSGGFQIFSLGATLDERGARFPDGLALTPEQSIAMQRAIGSDIMMALDHCIASTCTRAEAEAAMARTHRWAQRSLAAHERGAERRDDASPHALFAIVQGASFPALRRASADALTAMPGFDGYAIGGLAVGESRAEREDLTELVAEMLPRERPRYLMGVGTPIDLLEAVHRGVDMFDCVLPTAWAQQGIAFTSHGKIDLRRGVYRAAAQPLDAACACPACATYARSYLHHLVKCREPLGWQLLAFHNLAFYLALMRDIRGALDAGTFTTLYGARRDALAAVDRDNPPGPRAKARPAIARTRGAFRVEDSPRGFASIAHVASGEVMHSVSPPDEEAERLYVAQSQLVARAIATGAPICVWDVGLGAGHNAMAMLRRFAGSTAALTLISFERDLDAFELALAHGKAFPHLRTEAAHRFARDRAFVRAPIAWTLAHGDFRATFADQPAPDVILWDPFSAAVDEPMWSLATFEAVFARVAARDAPVELFTYTTSTAIRSSLLAAGFGVARGVATGPKAETTIAMWNPRGELAHPHLDRAWLDRRARSTARWASDVPVERYPELEARIARAFG